MRHMTCVVLTGLVGILVLGGCAQPDADGFAYLPDVTFPSAGATRSIAQNGFPTAKPPATRTAGRYPAEWYPPGGRISSRWGTIVIHHSATDVGGAQRFDRDHRLSRGWDELGYHFVIGNGTDTPDGAVEVGPRWPKQKHGAHCKTANNYYNEHGIGICLVGNFEKTRPSAAQLASLRRLVDFLCQEGHIAPDKICTHGGVTHQTACPGRNFPTVASLRSRLPVTASAQ